jgi:type VI secretion system secreted protein VgrG
MSESNDSPARAASAQTLLTRFTQDSRLLQLTTPLGSDKLLAECVRGEEGISQGFVFRIAALSTDAGIGLKSLIGQHWQRPLHPHLERQVRTFNKAGRI